MNRLLAKILIVFAGYFLVSIGHGAVYPLPAESESIVGRSQVVFVEPGDDLHSIAQRYDVGFQRGAAQRFYFGRTRDSFLGTKLIDLL